MTRADARGKSGTTRAKRMMCEINGKVRVKVGEEG